MEYITITNIQRFSIHDGPGTRTVVFFKGCPLHCPWCANPETNAVYPELSINLDKCLGCRFCVDACKKGFISIQDGHPVIDRLHCDRCFECVPICYSHTLSIEGKTRSVADVLNEVLRDRPFFQKTAGVLHYPVVKC